MAYPTAKNRKAVTNALERDGFVVRSQTASYIRFDGNGKAAAFAVIEQTREGKYFAVVKSLGFAA